MEKRDMRLIKQRIEEKPAVTNSLLRFNVLSRKSTILNSKAAKNEEATEYLMGEIDRIELHLDKLLAPQRTDEGQNEQNSHAQDETVGTSNTNMNTSENAIEDPDTTTQKGRPPLPKRMKSQIEQVEQKMKQQESKKKNKATSDENSDKNIIYNSKLY